MAASTQSLEPGSFGRLRWAVSATILDGGSTGGVASRQAEKRPESYKPRPRTAVDMAVCDREQNEQLEVNAHTSRSIAPEDRAHNQSHRPARREQTVALRHRLITEDTQRRCKTAPRAGIDVAQVAHAFTAASRGSLARDASAGRTIARPSRLNGVSPIGERGRTSAQVARAVNHPQRARIRDVVEVEPDGASDDELTM